MDTERYLLAVHRYVELSPVRPAMTVAAKDYRGSSAHASVGVSTDPGTPHHPAYLAMGAGAGVRGRAYRAWLNEGTGTEDLAASVRASSRSGLWGMPGSRPCVEKTLNRPAAVRAWGRPRKSETGIQA